jgi:hypothetical protein
MAQNRTMTASISATDPLPNCPTWNRLGGWRSSEFAVPAIRTGAGNVMRDRSCAEMTVA